MKITIFAATGGIGRQALNQAVAAGHDVTAVVRNPAALGDAVSRIRVVTVADLRTANPAALEGAVAGADGVLSGLGPRGRAESGVTSRATRLIIDAMETAGVRRLIVVSAEPVATVPSPNRPNPPRHDPGDGFLVRYVGNPIIKRVLREHYADLAVMEDLLRASTLDWTSVRPPRLTDKPMSGHYRIAIGQNVPGMTVSRADVAHFMLAALGQPETFRQAVGIAGPRSQAIPRNRFGKRE